MYCGFIAFFCRWLVKNFPRATNLHVRGVIAGVFLVALGVITYVYGTNMIRPEDPLSGSYGAVIGIFLGLAGVLVLFSSVFRGSLLS